MDLSNAETPFWQFKNAEMSILKICLSFHFFLFHQCKNLNLSVIDVLSIKDLVEKVKTGPETLVQGNYK